MTAVKIKTEPEFHSDVFMYWFASLLLKSDKAEQYLCDAVMWVMYRNIVNYA